MAILNFDAGAVEPKSSTFEVLPAGWYNAMIVDSEVKVNNAKTGRYISLTLRILDGRYANRQMFDIINIEHPNPIAVEIGQKTLSGYCHAACVIKLEDTQQLHNRPMQIRIGVKTDPSGQYEPSNVIRNVRSGTSAELVAASGPLAAPAPTYTAPAPAAAAAGTPPWAKRRV